MEKQFSITDLLQKDRIESKLNVIAHAAITPVAVATTTPPPSFQLAAQFEKFLDQLVTEQLQHADQLLKLNPSRREGIAKFLSELIRNPEPENPEETLKEFIRHDRTPQANEALKQLFKQIGLVQLGKALLLKSWNQLTPEDLKNLTAAIERGLRPFLNLQTSSSQLIQRNFYSWHTLSSHQQDQVWDLFQQLELEDPTLEKAKDWLLHRSRRLSAETLGERDRYSKLFYQHMWKSIQQHQLLRPSTRNIFGFCPTLRDGSLMEHAPSHIEWIGFEPLSFELLFCEIRFLWKQPKGLPLWVKGSSLEMSMEQQSQLQLSHCGKQNTLQQLEAITSCEIAMIAEENLIRTQSRTMAGQALRKQIDQHSVLKKLKQPQSTRGTYQACQALEKLRQGGVLIWAREEVLDDTAGKPALQFILNQAKILLIADLSALQCDQESIKRDLPKAFYILQKENQIEVRKSHRPIMIKTYGNISSSNDIQLLFDRIFSLLKKPDQSFPLEPFQLRSRISPFQQVEWEQHWFNPADDQMVDQIETLKRKSTPFGGLAAVRMISWTDLNGENMLTRSPKHFILWSEPGERGNEIFTAEELDASQVVNRKGNPFIIFPREESHSIPLQSLLRSQITREWLNYSAERKKGAWVLKESDIKSIPVPKHIDAYLQSEHLDQPAPTAFEEKLIATVASRPGEALRAMENNATEARPLKAKVFALTARILHQQQKEQATLFSMVRADGQVQTSMIEKVVLQPGDLCRIDQSPKIRFSPTLLEHQPITSITVMQNPSPGILLATSKGFTQFLHIADSWVRELLLEKLQALQVKIKEPTWNEICNEILIPKNPDQMKTVCVQIVKAYKEEKMRKKELIHLLGACLIESPPLSSPQKIGLLQ